jgi:hypothetical protein
MAPEHSIRRYRKWYAKLLRLYPKPHRERFGEGMEQTFNDLLRERQDAGGGFFALVFWVFAETAAGVVRERKAVMFKHNKRLIGIVIAIATLLLVPLVAMLFTDEVDWGIGDFIVAGVLLCGTGLTFEVAARKTGNTVYRTAVGVAVVTALILVWMNGAVGIIGSEDNPVNLMYFAVPLVGLVGALIARFRSNGMALALFATAIAQALVPVVALIVNRPPVDSTDALMGVLGVFVLNTYFVALFVVSGFLFRRAGATGS